MAVDNCPCPGGCNGCEKYTKEQIIEWLDKQAKLHDDDVFICGALEECAGLLESGHH